MGLQENLQTDTVESLQIRKPVAVEPGTSVRQVTAQLREHELGCAVVVDQDRKPIGVFTESMIVEMLAHHPQTIDEPIEKHMAEQVPWVSKSDPVADVLEAMQLKNIRLMCVVDENGCLVGLTGQRGLMEYIAEHFPGEVTVQRIGLSPYLADREGA